MKIGALWNRALNASLQKLLLKAKLLPDPEERGDLRYIPRAEIQDLVKPHAMIRVDASYSYSDGSLPWCDLHVLLSIAVDRHPKSVVEVGTFDGQTTRHLAVNLPESTIHTIDLPEAASEELPEIIPKDDFHLIHSRRVGWVFKSDVSITNVTQHFGDTATLAFPPAELYFIDGSHTYEYVRNDTEKALDCSVAKTILWHDCDYWHPGVLKYLRELTESGRPVRRIKGTHMAVLFR